MNDFYENEMTIEEARLGYRQYVRHICSRLGWAMTLLLVGIFTFELALFLLSGFLENHRVMGIGGEIYKLLNSEWFSSSGRLLITYAVILPFVHLIWRTVPAERPEPKKMRFRKFVMFYVLIQGSALLLNLLGLWINSFVAFRTGRNPADMNPVTDLMMQTDWFTLFYVAVAGPILEEYIFRWALLNRLRPMGEKASILFTAVLFGLFHGNLTQMLYATAIGAILGYMAVKTGRMRYNCLMHILVNSGSVALGFLSVAGAAGNVLALALTGLSMFAAFAMVIGAGIIYLVKIGRTYLKPGDWPEGVRYRDFASALFLNPGVMMFMGLNILMMGYYLFLA